MSHGDAAGPNCEEILARAYEFVDNELDNADCLQIQAHLAECAPCMRAIDYERLVKVVLTRSCCELAPVELRQRVIFSIRQAQMQVSDWREPQ